MSDQILQQFDPGSQHASPIVQAGTYRSDMAGRLWVYGQASAAIAKGELVCPVGAANFGVVVNSGVGAAAAASQQTVSDSGAFVTTTIVDGGFATKYGHQYTLWVDSSDGAGQGGPILARTDDTVDVYNVVGTNGLLSTALTTDSQYVVSVLSRFVKAPAAYRGKCTGVAQIAFTDEYWGWFLVKGQGVVLVDDSDSTIVAGQGIVPSATTAGAAEGVNTQAGTATSTTAATYADGFEVNAQVGISVSGDAGGDVFILALFDISEFPMIAYNADRSYPALGGIAG